MNVNQVQQFLAEMKDDDFKRLLLNVFDSRTPESQKEIVKAVAKRGKKNAQKTPEVNREVALQGNVAACSRSLQAPEGPSTPQTKPAFTKVPLMYRSDLIAIEEDHLVFIDVEMLTLKKKKAEDPHPMVASSVAIVNDDRELVLWSFVKWDQATICQTFPGLTGITRQMVENGHPIEIVKYCVEDSIKGKTVVGYNMEGDLRALSVTLKNEDKLDLAAYFVDTSGQQYSLKDLIFHFFGKEAQCGIHSAIMDARLTQKLYHKYIDLKKTYPNFMDYPNNKSIRRPTPKFNAENVGGMPCRCPKPAKKQKGKKRKTPKISNTVTVYCPGLTDDEADDW